MGEGDNDEGESSSPDESDDPSTTSSKIRRRLGPLSDLRFILANHNWIGKVGTNPNHSSFVVPILAYSFVIPGKGATILSAHVVISPSTG